MYKLKHTHEFIFLLKKKNNKGPETTNSAALNMTSIYIGVSKNYSLSCPSKKLGFFREKSNFISGTRNAHGELGRSWHARKKGRLQ